jgi:Ni/Co efflux regulator RcnB
MMKKLIVAALAASVAASPVLAAPWNHGPDNRGRYEQRHDNHGRYTGHDRVEYRKWVKGQRFDSRYARNYRVISSPRAYHLRSAPRGYRWVQSGNDAVLVGITTGIIASVLANAIH